MSSTGDAGDANLGDGICETATPGECTLRAAIQQANATAGLDAISFNIPGAGPHTIVPATALPSITDPVVIDGYTQPGASANSAGPGAPTNAVLKIELAGSSTTNNANFAGLTITNGGGSVTSGSTTIRGLAINRFFLGAIAIQGAIGRTGNNRIEGNFLGTDVTGTAVLGTGMNGVAIVISSNDVVGGTEPAARNVISMGQFGRAIGIESGTNTAIIGNYIGTNAAGTAPLGNADAIWVINGSRNTTIGGITAAARNVISGSRNFGVFIFKSSFTPTTSTDPPERTTVQGNLIGMDAAGVGAMGNAWPGIYILESSDNTIGGTEPGAGNVIANNGFAGVVVNDGGAGQTMGNAILGNTIFANGGLGIDLTRSGSPPSDGLDGVTANDTGDSDIGPNNFQNFPILTSATSGSTTVQGALNSTSSTTFRLEFFASASCDASGNGEGQRFLDAKSVQTDGSGNAPFSFALSGSAAIGEVVTATATDPNNNTSEFSPCVAVGEATPTPTQTTTPSATATWTPSPTLTSTVTPSTTPTPSSTLTETPTSTLTVTPTSSPTSTLPPSLTVTLSPTATASATPTNTATPSPTFSPTTTPSATATGTPTLSPSPTRPSRGGQSVTPTPSASITATATMTLGSSTGTATSTSTATALSTVSATSTPACQTGGPVQRGPTPTPCQTGTPTASPTPTLTQTPGLDGSPSVTPSATLSPTVSVTPGQSCPTVPATPSKLGLPTATPCGVASPTGSLTPTPTTPIVTATLTQTPAVTSTATATSEAQTTKPTATPCGGNPGPTPGRLVPTPTPTTTPAACGAGTATPTPTATLVPQGTATPTPTPSGCAKLGVCPTGLEGALLPGITWLGDGIARPGAPASIAGPPSDIARDRWYLPS